MISATCAAAGRKTRWTSETARAASLLAHAQRKAEREQIEERVRIALSRARTSDLPSIRLPRLLELVSIIDERIKRSRKPEEALAWAKLAAELQEQERILAGRPLPGRKDAKRPDAPRPPAVPLPDEPEPAPGPG